MATISETMWVSDPAQLQATVQTLVGQGGVVQQQSETQVQVHIKKKLNVPVLVVGLILCLVPGLVYLIWYSASDQNQLVTVQIGRPGTINTDHEHWYDKDAVDGAVPGSVPPPKAEPAPEAQAPLPPAPEGYDPAPPPVSPVRDDPPPPPTL